MIDQGQIQSTSWLNKRRSQRVVLQVPVRVRGRLEDEKPLSELTQTLVVNAHGALISLATHVRPGQELVLKHGISGKEEEARVVHVQLDASKKGAANSEVGIQFKRPAPDFWGIDFPPSDWKKGED